MSVAAIQINTPHGWNILPIPTVQNIGDIGCVCPLNVIRHLLAFAKEIDNVTLTFNTDTEQDDSALVVLHMGQSKVVCDGKNEVIQLSQQEPWFTAQAKAVVLAWAQDWRDGFGANRTKQNQKSTECWTFSVATPKDSINSISNTLPIALGLKKNDVWPLVEHQFWKDMEVLDKKMSNAASAQAGLHRAPPKRCHLLQRQKIVQPRPCQIVRSMHWLVERLAWKGQRQWIQNSRTW